MLYLDDGYSERLAAATPLNTPTPVAPRDPAVVFFTSGSTGRSKGAVHTHASLTSAAVTMNAELEIPDGERTLHFLPLFSSCMEHLIPLTLARGTHIVQSQFDASGVWEAVLKYGVTHFDAVPTTLRRILEVAPATIPTMKDLLIRMMFTRTVAPCRRYRSDRPSAPADRNSLPLLPPTPRPWSRS